MKHRHLKTNLGEKFRPLQTGGLDKRTYAGIIGKAFVYPNQNRCAYRAEKNGIESAQPPPTQEREAPQAPSL